MWDAIKWMKASWDDLPTSTIEKCFIHCGFKEEDNPADSDFTAQSNPSENPVDMAGDELLDGLSFDDFVTFDDNLSTNVTIEGDWEQTIMDKAKGVIDEIHDESSDDDEEPEDNSRIIGDREAFFMVNELKKYALSWNETGLTQALTEAEELIEHSVLKNSSRLRQSTLSTYFSVA